MKLDSNYFSFLTATCLCFFVTSNSVAASPPVHCQPQDVACLQSMNSNQHTDSKVPERKYDASGRVIIERIGDTTTYYTYDENGKQIQQYKEVVKSSASK